MRRNYDLTENEIGHPAFHAQLKHKFEFAAIVQKEYTGKTLDPKNLMENLLKTARLPSAQMHTAAGWRLPSEAACAGFALALASSPC